MICACRAVVPRPVPPHTAPRRHLVTQVGLYTSASPYTCAGYAASCGVEWIDAQQWAKWKVDFMMEDAVRTQYGCTRIWSPPPPSIIS